MPNCLGMVLYFYKKCILQRTLLMSGRATLKDRYFFSHCTASVCGVMIAYFGNKKLLVNKISKGNNRRILTIEAKIEIEEMFTSSL